MKVCKTCGEEKELSEFHENAKTKDKKHTICKVCNIRKSREWRENNRERYLQRNRKSKYGIEEEEYRQMIKDQSGLCAICKTPEEEVSRSTLFIDHCHETGVIRGLLCHSCNSGLGYFKDRVDLLHSAKEYLDGGTKENQWRI